MISPKNILQLESIFVPIQGCLVIIPSCLPPHPSLLSPCLTQFLTLAVAFFLYMCAHACSAPFY